MNTYDEDHIMRLARGLGGPQRQRPVNVNLDLPIGGPLAQQPRNILGNMTTLEQSYNPEVVPRDYIKDAYLGAGGDQAGSEAAAKAVAEQFAKKKIVPLLPNWLQQLL